MRVDLNDAGDVDEQRSKDPLCSHFARYGKYAIACRVGGVDLESGLRSYYARVSLHGGIDGYEFARFGGVRYDDVCGV